MNVRQAAALALLGWYLMAPPINERIGLDLGAPLSQWQALASFDTAAECKASLKAKNRLALVLGNSRVTETMANSVCIASDDPRLKP